MKKIFFLLNRTTGYWLRFAISLLFFAAVFFGERQFLADEIKSIFHGKESIGTLGFFPVTLIGVLLLVIIWSVIKYYDKQFRDLIFWLAWPKFFTAVFYCLVMLPWVLISCAVYGIIHMVLFGQGAGETSFLLFIVSLLLVWIYLFIPEHYIFVHKRRRLQSASVSVSVNPRIDAVKISINNRAGSVSYVLLFFLIFLSCFFTSRFFPYEYRIYFCLATIILLLGIEDFYWKNEENNFSLYRISAVSLKKYLIVQYASSMCFNVWALLLFFFTFKDPLRIMLLFLLLCFAQFYWQQVYVYLGLSDYSSLGIRNLFCILFMILMLIPVGNIVVSLLLLFKNSKGWNENDLD